MLESKLLAEIDFHLTPKSCFFKITSLKKVDSYYLPSWTYEKKGEILGENPFFFLDASKN